MKIHTYEHNWFSLSNLSAMMRCDWSRVHLTAQQCPLAPPVHCVTSNIRFDSVTIRILHFYGQLMRWNVPYQKWCARDQDICDRTARTWRHELRIHAAMGRIGVPWRNCRQFAVHLPLNLSQQMRFMRWTSSIFANKHTQTPNTGRARTVMCSLRVNRWVPLGRDIVWICSNDIFMDGYLPIMRKQYNCQSGPSSIDFDVSAHHNIAPQHISDTNEWTLSAFLRFNYYLIWLFLYLNSSALTHR